MFKKGDTVAMAASNFARRILNKEHNAAFEFLQQGIHDFINISSAKAVSSTCLLVLRWSSLDETPYENGSAFPSLLPLPLTSESA